MIIQITKLLIEPKNRNLNHISLVRAPMFRVDINLDKPETIVEVKNELPLSISLKDIEFQLLMRTLTQNFIEKTIVFDDDELRKEQRMNR